MGNEVTAQERRKELIRVLQSSLYVGAKADSVELVIDYCDAAKLDPMQKPVHIVPMNVKNPVSGNYEWRDVIMPGIGLYRIQADRSHSMAGITEPEFGDEITRDFTDKSGNKVSMTFPEWCKVTVRKLVGEHIVDYVGKEYWLENYATDSGKSTAPNSMWRKRPKGQIAKCAEAQALRKGWPEIGAAPTAEEMEGKTIEGEYTVERQAQGTPESLPEYPDGKFKTNLPLWRSAIEQSKTTPDRVIGKIESNFRLSEQQKKDINAIKVPIEGQAEQVKENDNGAA